MNNLRQPYFLPALPLILSSITITFFDKLSNSCLISNHSPYPLIELEQTHSDQCLILNDLTQITSRKLPRADAVITSLRQVILCVRNADCLPVLIYHPQEIIVVVHAGRKDTELGILSKTLVMIRKRFLIKFGLFVWFGPNPATI